VDAAAFDDRTTIPRGEAEITRPCRRDFRTGRLADRGMTGRRRLRRAVRRSAGRSWGIALVGFCAFASPLLAQVEVRGRVIERGIGNAVGGASIQLGGLAVAVTTKDGDFRFPGVEPGRYELRIRALGYADHEQVLLVRRDTMLIVEMEVTPVPLDTIGVESRTISVRGLVREKGTRLGLIDVEVLSSVNRSTNTNAAGRFKLTRIPAELPVALQFRGFGYLPFDTVVAAAEDTTLTFELEQDPLVQRMISVQVERLDNRSRPYRTAIMPVLDREDLLRNINMSVLDLLTFKYSFFLRRVACILIDDQQSYNGLEELALFLPDELERIEVLERGAMLRIYTRDYIAKMIGGGVSLARPVMTPSRPPLCR
jgi:Carboxypeptidase regulatory-like domain